MSLVWFQFHAKAFLTDTLALNTEAKGAYLMLLLDYFEQGVGAVADDEILATITGLPLETWKRHARVVMPKFSVTDGRLYHSFMADVIRDGVRQHNRTKAAIEARWGKTKRPASVTDNVTEPKIRQPHATDNVTESVEASVRRQDKDKERSKEESSYEDSSARGMPVTETVVTIGRFESVLPDSFDLSATDLIRCQSEGYAKEVVGDILRSFKRYHINAGTMQPDWIAAWWRWWERKKPGLHPSEKPQAKPRVEVSRKAKAAKTALPDDWQPNETNAKVAAEEGYDLAQITQHFRDVCGANGYRYANHHLAFNNFIRNQKNFTRGRSNGQAQAKPARGSLVEAGRSASAELARRIAAIEAPEGGDGRGNAAVRELSVDGLREPAGGAGDDGDGAERLPAAGGGAGDEA